MKIFSMDDVIHNKRYYQKVIKSKKMMKNDEKKEMI